MHSFTHVALRVERLRDAEAFYRNLFTLEVAFREAETPDGWLTLPPSADWDDAERAVITLNLVMLFRDGFRLALEEADAVAENGQLSHIGLFADADELERLRKIAALAGCEVVSDHPRGLILDDDGCDPSASTAALEPPAVASTHFVLFCVIFSPWHQETRCGSM